MSLVCLTFQGICLALIAGRHGTRSGYPALPHSIPLLMMQHTSYSFPAFIPLDSFSEWMTTPMPLPTPEEQLTDMPPVSSYTPAYTAVQEFPNNHTPSPSLPLTPDSLASPESLVSPESFCNSDEVDEVLSYLSGDPVTPLGPNDAFNVFPSPTSNQIYNENCKPCYIKGRTVFEVSVTPICVL